MNTQDPFAAVRVSNQTESIPKTIENDPFASVRVQGNLDSTSEESLINWGARNLASNASRIGEQVLGRYGNVEKFAREALKNIPAVGGLIGWGLSELVGPENWEKMLTFEGSAPKIPMPGEEKDQRKKGSFLPSSEDFKELSQIATGGYTKPKTEGEEAFQEFTEDVGSLISLRTGIGSPNVAAGKRPMMQLINRHLLIPAAANATKQTLKSMGVDEDTANMGKMAIWLPFTLSNEINANKYAADLMNKGREMFPKNLMANTRRLQSKLDSLERSLSHADPRTSLARQAISGLKKDIENGQTSIQSLLTQYDGINAAKRSRGMFELGKSDQQYATKSINKVLNALREEITDTGSNNPEALKNWQNGLNAWASIHQSNKIQNWVKNLANGPYGKFLTGPAAALFGGAALGASKLPLAVSAPAAGITTGAYNTGKVLMRMWKSPVLRNYYWNAVNAAIGENKNAFISNYNKLNKELKKESSVQKPT